MNELKEYFYSYTILATVSGNVHIVGYGDGYYSCPVDQPFKVTRIFVLNYIKSNQVRDTRLNVTFTNFNLV